MDSGLYSLRYKNASERGEAAGKLRSQWRSPGFQPSQDMILRKLTGFRCLHQSLKGRRNDKGDSHSLGNQERQELRYMEARHEYQRRPNRERRV